MAFWDFIKRTPGEKWALVHTIEHPVTGDGKPGKIFYHLFESSFGNRKVETKCTILGFEHFDGAKNLEIYHQKIYRWEMGRHDPEIPRYSDIGPEDTANYLKGTI